MNSVNLRKIMIGKKELIRRIDLLSNHSIEDEKQSKISSMKDWYQGKSFAFGLAAAMLATDIGIAEWNRFISKT